MQLYVWVEYPEPVAMPYDERDEETGEFKQRFSHEEILDSLKNLSGSASTKEVSNEVGCAYRTAYEKLTQLEEEGHIESRKVGNARLWLLSDSQ